MQQNQAGTVRLPGDGGLLVVGDPRRGDHVTVVHLILGFHGVLDTTEDVPFVEDELVDVGHVHGTLGDAAQETRQRTMEGLGDGRPGHVAGDDGGLAIRANHGRQIGIGVHHAKAVAAVRQEAQEALAQVGVFGEITRGVELRPRGDDGESVDADLLFECLRK